MLAAGLFKYGVAHYEPKEAGECCAISAPRRPAVRFQNTDVPAVDLDEEEPEEELLQLELSYQSRLAIRQAGCGLVVLC